MRAGSPHPLVRNRKGSDASIISNTDSNATAGQSPTTSGPSKEKDFGELENMLPLDALQMEHSILVPAKFDYTKPLLAHPADGSRPSRLEQQLAFIDESARGVKRNITAVVFREARRIELQCAKREADLAAAGKPVPRCREATTAEEDQLLSTMSTWVHSYNSASLEVPANFDWHLLMGQVPIAPGATPREAAVTEMTNLMRYGIEQIESYGDHIQNAKGERRQAYAREISKELAQEPPSGPSGIEAMSDPMDIG